MPHFVDSGDTLKKMVFIVALLCFTTLCFNTIAENTPVAVNSQQKQAAQPMSFSAEATNEQASATSASAPISKETLTVLKQDSGMNFSEMNFTLFSAVNEFGMAGLGIGEVVKFNSPKPGWKLKGIQIIGLSGFNNTTKLFQPDRTFLVEVRDSNADLLYKFVDIQNIYFASTAGPVAHKFDVPALPVTEDFYVVFYDRGSLGLGMEKENGTGNSYFIINSKLVPAEFKKTNTNETLKVNWLIRAVGE